MIMNFTGKNKEDFDKWIEVQKGLDGGYLDDCLFILSSQNYSFNELPKSMRWGVIQDYAESIPNTRLDVYQSPERDRWAYIVWVNGDDNAKHGKFKKSRPEARTAAIEKFDELRNLELNK